MIEQMSEHGPAYMAGALKRAEDNIKRLQAENAEQEQTNHAIAVQRDALRQKVTYMEFRLAEERDKSEMAAVCLRDIPTMQKMRKVNHAVAVGVEYFIELALKVLDLSYLLPKCESCQGPCDEADTVCQACGWPQPKHEERCPERDMSGVANAINEGKRR